MSSPLHERKALPHKRKAPLLKSILHLNGVNLFEQKKGNSRNNIGT